MKLPWKRHRCPSSVIIEIRINGETIVGPMDSEHLGLIARYGGGTISDPLDLMGESVMAAIGQSVEVLATYKPS